MKILLEEVRNNRAFFVKMKTEETLKIEKLLSENLFSSNPSLAKRYGTTEVRIGFDRNSHHKESVDFLSYDPKANEYYCYEIKVSMADYRSNSKKTWLGDYNYLVLSEKLFNEKRLENWIAEIPANVGIIVADISTNKLKTVKKAKHQEISNEQKFELSQSLVRTLFYQNTKLRRKLDE